MQHHMHQLSHGTIVHTIGITQNTTGTTAQITGTTIQIIGRTIPATGAATEDKSWAAAVGFNLTSNL